MSCSNRRLYIDCIRPPKTNLCRRAGGSPPALFRLRKDGTSMGKLNFAYYQAQEAEQFAFYRIPKQLFTDNRFASLSTEAKVLYGLMLDRMSLSRKSGWIDTQGRVFIIFPLEQIMTMLGCGKDKGVKVLKELDSGIGLIKRIKQGFGNPTIIYVLNFTAEITEPLETSEKPKSLGVECRSQEFGKSEVKTSKKPKSLGRKNRSQEFGKTDSINTNIIKTDIIKTDISILSIDQIDEIRSTIKNHIEYDWFKNNLLSWEMDYVDELLELMTECVASTNLSLRIGRQEYPQEYVKQRFLQLDSGHIKYVLDSLKSNKTEIKNIKAYLLATLFNAPSTINNFYHAVVNACE